MAPLFFSFGYSIQFETKGCLMCLFLIPDENIFPFFGFVPYISFLSTTCSDYEVSPTVICCMRKSL